MHIEGAGVTASPTGIEGVALVRLLTWMSPAFPLGSFSYSHGLETAISEGSIRDKDSLHAWLDALLARGSGWSDAVLIANAWRANTQTIDDLVAINDHALAMAPSAERYLETTQQGAAFYKASLAWPVSLHERIESSHIDTLALQVIIGAMAREHGIALDAILPAALHAFMANLVSVAIRLVPLGQTDGLAVQARLEESILKTSTNASMATLADIGTCCLHSDIAAMRHEQLTTRIFRS